ncbi:RlpA-like double-psi beta-barrel domain-containing protein [Streptomyces sp. NPDC006529]|uniref:RlpA-like double-psi beta-barrel domain-containing protein n=1 Tax=Streptomyces sp. NPDC006529 TaxID=3157177 RepID=UPI0033A7E6AC
MRARIAITAATAVLAVGSAALVTIATASASEDTGAVVAAPSTTGQPVEPTSTASASASAEETRAVVAAPSSTERPVEPTSTPTAPPGSTVAPDPGVSTTPPAPGKPVRPPKGNFTGMAGWFQPDGVAGACGERIGDDDMSVALDHRVFESGGHGRNAYCGLKVVVTYKGKSVTVRVVDAAPTTPKNGLDLTPRAFSALAPRDGGDIKVTWHFAK